MANAKPLRGFIISQAVGYIRLWNVVNILLRAAAHTLPASECGAFTLLSLLVPAQRYITRQRCAHHHRQDDALADTPRKYRRGQSTRAGMCCSPKLIYTGTRISRFALHMPRISLKYV
jgi:hypothetical protein